MGVNVSLKAFNRMDHSLQIDRRPDVCPLCHHAIELAEYHYAYYNTTSQLAQLVFRCPKLTCQGLFFANYGRNPSTNQLFFINASPSNLIPRTFSEIIMSISKEFCEIYNQALASESIGHLKICGVGYRMSLEFLVKDY